ncbi:MAG: GNAT family protein [Ancrocorticia sp.]
MVNGGVRSTGAVVSLVVPEMGHATELLELVNRNQEHFAPGEPLRPDSYFTLDAQRKVIRGWKAARESSDSYAWLIEYEGQIVGRASLNIVIRGAFQSASVAYAVDREATRRGIATAALLQMVDFAFAKLDLHRLQGETLLTNHASQATLQRCGFVRYGTAPDYLFIQGRWRDHVLFQRLNPNHSSLQSG